MWRAGGGGETARVEGGRRRERRRGVRSFIARVLLEYVGLRVEGVFKIVRNAWALGTSEDDDGP